MTSSSASLTQGLRASTRVSLQAAIEALRAASDSPNLDAELLLAFAWGRPRASLIAFPERLVDEAAAQRFGALVERRADGEPLAYLLGEWEFFSLPLDIGSAVLVPRPETELLVEVAIDLSKPRSAPRILDLGTGSGAVALAIGSVRRDAIVTATDVSAAALTIARCNGVRLQQSVRWLESRWFDRLAGERFDLIVSNPPYVARADIRGALTFEPSLALDGGVDGLEAYRAILGSALCHLEPRGALVLEHGAAQQNAIAELAAQRGWRVVAAHKDLEGRDRVLVLAEEGSS